MHIFCLDYTVSASKSYPLRVQNKLTTSSYRYRITPPPSVGWWEIQPVGGGHSLFRKGIFDTPHAYRQGCVSHCFCTSICFF